MIYFTTAISLLVVLFLVPVWFAGAVEILNGTNSKLRFVPIINECRAEYLYFSKVGPIFISWILMPLCGVGSILTWYYMFGSTFQIIMHYAFFVALAFWYIAKVISNVIIMRELGLTSYASCIISSLIYPLGYYTLKNTCKIFKKTNG